MPIERIDTLDDPRVADFRDVPDGQRLRDGGAFVAEGRLVVRRLLQAERFRVRALLLTEARLEGVVRGLPVVADDLRIYLTSPRLLQHISGYNFHRGCLALGERPLSLGSDQLVAAAPAGRPLVVVERVGNADNVGGIFRNAAAFGSAGVLLSPGCCDPL